MIRNDNGYIRHSIDLRTTFLKKRMNQLTKKFYKNFNNTSSKIIAELPDLEISNPVNRQLPRYALTVEDKI